MTSRRDGRKRGRDREKKERWTSRSRSRSLSVESDDSARTDKKVARRINQLLLRAASEKIRKTRRFVSESDSSEDGHRRRDWKHEASTSGVQLGRKPEEEAEVKSYEVVEVEEASQASQSKDESSPVRQKSEEKEQTSEKNTVRGSGSGRESAEPDKRESADLRESLRARAGERRSFEHPRAPKDIPIGDWRFRRPPKGYTRGESDPRILWNDHLAKSKAVARQGSLFDEEGAQIWFPVTARPDGETRASGKTFHCPHCKKAYTDFLTFKAHYVEKHIIFCRYHTRDYRIAYSNESPLKYPDEQFELALQRSKKFHRT